MNRLPGLLALVILSACGQKGPPLAPIVYLPRPVTEVVAKRVENEVVLQFTVPTVNTDGSGPADLGKIEVYAHTGPLPAPADFLKYGTLVASVEIKQPPEPQEKSDAAEATDAKSAAGTPPVTKVEPPIEEPSKSGLVEQGSKTSVRETLTPKHLEIGPMPPARPLPPADPKAPVVVVEKIETPGTVNFDLTPQRFYAIFPISESRNRRGPVFGPMPVMLIDPLSPPETLKVGLCGRRHLADLARPAGRPGGAGCDTCNRPVHRQIAERDARKRRHRQSKSIERPTAPWNCLPISKPRGQRMSLSRPQPTRSRPARSRSRDRP